MELRTKARRLKMEHGLDLLIVDYLQLMQPGSSGRESNRVQEVSEISRGLKALARELGIPVLALSQLSRQTEMRFVNLVRERNDGAQSGGDSEPVM
jgi:replicative DNA helicase